MAYAGGWKKLELFWDVVIRTRHVNAMLPLLEGTLDAYGHARRRRRGPRASNFAAMKPRGWVVRPPL
jgi:hypothetical protein